MVVVGAWWKHEANVFMVRADEIMRIIAIIIIVSMSAPACSGKISEQELIGTYVANYGNEKLTLTIYANHNYTHVVASETREMLKTEATWVSLRLPQYLKHLVVEFNNFEPAPSYGSIKKGWVTEAQRTLLGSIQLCFDDDVGYCYVKNY